MLEILFTQHLRLFGEAKFNGAIQSDDEEYVKKLDQKGYCVLPPSGKFRDLIDQLDFNKLVWPTFPLSRQEIRLLEPGLNHQEENNLLYKSEEFWVKNNFKNSNKDLLNFVTKLLKRNKCR